MTDRRTTKSATDSVVIGGPLALALALAIALLLSGCGGDDDDDGAESTTTAVAASTTEDAADTTSTSSGSTTTSTTTEPDGTTVEVFFSTGDGSDCSLVEGFTRPVDGDVDPLRAAFDELVGGPTAEEIEAGAGSMFSAQTAGLVVSVSQRDGLLLVDVADLRSLMPNVSTSCGSEALLAQLRATAFQFPSVDRVRYLLDGSCDDFANWLQRECFDTNRAGEQLGVPTIERASGSGCAPPSADTLPDGRWFGFVAEAEADEVSFDLACWFTGGAAVAAASEDGEESPPPNDFHIRNERDTRRTIGVDPAAEVAWLPQPGDPASVEVVDYETWVGQRTGELGVWLQVEDGLVVSIEEQYVP